MPSTIALVTLAISTTALAQPVMVQIDGEVEFNQVASGPFGDVNPGDAASIIFMLDAANFMDSPNFPTRGYEIDQASFDITLGSVSAGLQNPFPGGMTPYFVIRNDDPAVDGFFLSTNVDFPLGVPLDVAGQFGQFTSQFSVTYENDPLDSLDIIDAAGTYDFTGLSVFNFTVDDGPFQPIGMIFDHMTITVVPAPATLALLAPLALRRRRR